MYIILSIISRLDKYSTIIIDDLDSHMHYDSIMTIINYANEKNVQLIFSSHNTYILQKLRPDQIIITNYNNGFSTYNKLSDIYPNIREINNVEKCICLDYLMNKVIKKEECNIYVKHSSFFIFYDVHIFLIRNIFVA